MIIAKPGLISDQTGLFYFAADSNFTSVELI